MLHRMLLLSRLLLLLLLLQLLQMLCLMLCLLLLLVAFPFAHFQLNLPLTNARQRHLLLRLRHPDAHHLLGTTRLRSILMTTHETHQKLRLRVRHRSWRGFNTIATL